VATAAVNNPLRVYGLPLLLAGVGTISGILWSLNANDAAQNRQLDEIERRAEQARLRIEAGFDRLSLLERQVALIQQRIEARREEGRR
jgi:hypothetical protein